MNRNDKLEQLAYRIELRSKLTNILRAFESENVETTAGLVVINGGRAMECDKANWFHHHMPSLEKDLKNHAKHLILTEIKKLDEWIDERLKS